METSYLSLGGVEIFNGARLNAYLLSVGSPLTSVGSCFCPTLTNEVLGDGEYTTPDDPLSPAPWYDSDVPESKEFAGLMVLSVEGIDDYPVTRTITTGVTGGGAIGPARVQPRTVTVTALVLASTCCGVEYGLHWLSEVLQGCVGGLCDGDCATMYSCCPGDDTLTPDAFNAKYRRTLRRVALVEGPRIISRVGDGCGTGECQMGADILTVEFVLTAATPWLYTDLTPILEVVPPRDDTATCVTWCIRPTVGVPAPGCEDECRFAPCATAGLNCSDPRCRPPAPPTPTTAQGCFCIPLADERDCYDMDLTGRPKWSTDVPMITVRAGSQDLRNLTLTFYERTVADAALTCDQIADLKRCDPHSVYAVQFVPAGGAVTLDGQISRALVQCGSGPPPSCESSSDVYGEGGAPPTWKAFDCARFCLCITTDIQNPPASSALVTVAVSGRGY